MNTNSAPSPIARLLGAARIHGRIALRSAEMYISLVVSAATWIVIGTSRKLDQSTQLPTVLVGYSALGLAVTAVVLTAVAMLVASLGEDHYREVLEAAGGVQEALDPFLHVAYVSGLAIMSGVSGLFVWEMSLWARPGAFAIPTFFALWSALGSISLVGLIVFHGRMRGELNASIRSAQQSLAAIGEERAKRQASNR